ncbi:MAG: alanine racemase [Clostridia bacterium]|nr:alanine racemase [Clostridia bacterium]
MIAGDTRIYVSLKKLGENLDALSKLVGNNVAIMAVVKANAYGHGAKEVAPVLLSHGASYLAVARLEEALEIRKSFPDAPLFVLGYTPDYLLKTAVQNDITLTVFSYSQAMILSEAAREFEKTAKVHLKVETGFNRLGTDDINELLKICEVENVCKEGIYSHLALKDRASDEIQLERFLNIVNDLQDKGYTFKYRHIADSISAVDYPDFRLDMIRPGAVLYGMKSYEDEEFKVKPIMSMQTKIARLRAIKEGEGVGYDFEFCADRDMKIATLPFGYADGYPRALGGKSYVTIRGKKCSLIGIMCMDQCVADVTDVDDVQVGDTVIIYGDGSDNTLSVEEAAKLAKCNKNEILCRLTSRPVRIYEE